MPQLDLVPFSALFSWTLAVFFFLHLYVVVRTLPVCQRLFGARGGFPSSQVPSRPRFPSFPH